MSIQWKKPENNGGEDPDRPSKKALIGSLVIITMNEYDPAFETSYGKQPMADFDLIVVDGEHAGWREEGRREFGNLGKQIGSALVCGDVAVGRYVGGTGAAGREWYGIEWAEEPGDFTAAEKVLGEPPVEAEAKAKSKAPF